MPVKRRSRGSICEAGAVLTRDVVGSGLTDRANLDGVVELKEDIDGLDVELREAVVGVDMGLRRTVDRVASLFFSDSIQSIFLSRWIASPALCLPFLDATSILFSAQYVTISPDVSCFFLYLYPMAGAFLLKNICSALVV